jgi:cyclophilin family peptidyl-prolyl cis-trans isomerase
MFFLRNVVLGLFLALTLLTQACDGDKLDTSLLKDKSNPVVKLETTHGAVYIELYKKEAPVSVDNFISYVNSGYYDGTIFHRVIKGFMVQGGGFNPGMTQKKVKDSIINEAANGLHNVRGTVAMARTQIVDSATSQFFINVVDNLFLDFKSKRADQFGYAVFGNVVSGMDVVDLIRNEKTTTVGYFRDVPAADIVIKNANLVKR